MYNLSPTKAIINLNNLRHNLAVIRTHLGSIDVMAVVKADAYGHGAIRIAQCLQKESIHMFAVATVAEAVKLREHGILERILVLGAPFPEFLPAYVQYDLDLTLHDLSFLEVLKKENDPIRIHVKIDTGMTRLGIWPQQWEDARHTIETMPNLTLVGNWTHFAVSDNLADGFTEQQINLFSVIANKKTHVQNTAGILNQTGFPTKYAPSWARIGVGLWGIDPCEPMQEQKLLPVMKLVSKIAQVKYISRGTSVSYGRTWKAPCDTWVATVAAGYADGYIRHLSNRGWVEVNGKRYRVIGKICMDMLMIEVGPTKTVAYGDEVVLWGSETLGAAEVASWGETIPYTLVTGVSHRVPREYLDE